MPPSPDGKRLQAAIWGAVVLLLALFAYGQYLRKHGPPLAVELQLTSSGDGPGQLFYRPGDGYSETRSQPLALQHDGQLHTYVAQLPANKPIRAIRLDPGTHPGMIQLQRLRFRYRTTTTSLDGTRLRAAIGASNQLQLRHGPSSSLLLQAQGDDPFIEFQLPPALVATMQQRQRAGRAAMALGLSGLLLLGMWQRHRLAHGARRFAGNRQRLILSGGLLAGSGLLWLARSGCDGLCSPRGLGYGVLLLLAALAFALMGFAALRLLRWRQVPGRPSLFLALVFGQALLALYVLLRSALQALLPLPGLGAMELFLLVAAAGLWLHHKAARHWWRSGWLALELGLLAAVCLAIADRELPRIVMLSSDPDTHAYFARLVEKLGGLPWHGNDVFHYPAGTGVFGFLWAKLALLDVRNAITALPLLQALLAPLLIAEALALRARRSTAAALVFAAALGITACGLLLPLYRQYFHMEGAGRQMAIALLAACLLPLLPRQPQRLRNAPATLAITTLCLLALAILNPINIVVPLLLLAVYCLRQLILHRRLPWLTLCPLLLLPLLLLDPYYQTLLLGNGAQASRFTVSPTLRQIPLPELLHHWRALLAQGPWTFLRESLAFLPGQRWPMFGVLLVLLLPPCLILQARTAARGAAGRLVAALLAAALAVLLLWALDRLFATTLNDRRFYLLHPYFGLSLGQLKILLITTLLAWLAALGASRWPKATAAGLVALIVLADLGMHRTQAIEHRPRMDYCGSLGCASGDDLAVLAAVERRWQRGQLAQGFVLLPNSRHHARNEAWIFPVTGARALPFFDTPPPAFYYYQGHPDFTTANYLRHVCQRLDRAWLLARGVRYVFIPSYSDAACLHDRARLIAGSTVIAARGDSRFLELPQ